MSVGATSKMPLTTHSWCAAPKTAPPASACKANAKPYTELQRQAGQRTKHKKLNRKQRRDVHRGRAQCNGLARRQATNLRQQHAGNERAPQFDGRRMRKRGACPTCVLQACWQSARPDLRPVARPGMERRPAASALRKTLPNPNAIHRTHRGARTHDHKVKSLALCRLS